MTIHVAQIDIDFGKSNDCESCPIARAIGRVFPGSEVYVLGDTVTIDKVFYSLPPECWGFVCDFDKGRPVFPFSFTLDLGLRPEGYAML
jgi:hypothetical protein